MKTRTGRQVVLCALLLACPLVVQAQQSAAANVYGGFSFVRTDDTVNALGWEASYSEYPYTSLSWFGGSIEANGVYAQPMQGLLNKQMYTFMGGPTFTTHALRRLPSLRRFQPFGHILLGAVITKLDTTGKGAADSGQATSESSTAFGLAAGGGIDFEVNRAFALRGSADWLLSTFHDASIDRQNNFRTSAGIVLKF